MNIHQHFAGHMTKMAAMPIYGKTHLNLLSTNHWADFDETLYEASETYMRFISCANYYPGLTMTYFTAWSKFAT